MMEPNLNLIEVDEEASQLISQAASSILQAQAPGAENLDPVSLSQQYTPAAVESATGFVAALAALLQDVNAVGNLTKTVHFVTNADRKETMFVHVVADGTVHTNASDKALDYKLFMNADHLIVGPKNLDPAQQQEVIKHNVRIHLAASTVIGKPDKVIFNVTGSTYAISDGYSITKMIKLNNVGQLQVN